MIKKKSIEYLSTLITISQFKIHDYQDFLGNPAVKTPCFAAVGTDSISGWGTKILHIAQLGQKIGKNLLIKTK